MTRQEYLESPLVSERAKEWVKILGDNDYDTCFEPMFNTADKQASFEEALSQKYGCTAITRVWNSLVDQDGVVYHIYSRERFLDDFPETKHPVEHGFYWITADKINVDDVYYAVLR